MEFLYRQGLEVLQADKLILYSKHEAGAGNSFIQEIWFYRSTNTQLRIYQVKYQNGTGAQII
jgi:lipopolysaccharide export system protein LptA